jgi:hypothetical protein
MSVLYPPAIVRTASITSCVRMTLYHRPISVYPANAQTSKVVTALGGKARGAAARNSVTQPVSNIPGAGITKNQMAIAEAKGK